MIKTTSRAPDQPSDRTAGGDTDMRTAAARPKTRQAWKYGGSVSTPSVLVRLAFTAVLLGVGGVISVVMVHETHQPDSRVAGFVVFVLGVWCLVTVFALPHIWRPSAEWRRRRYEGRQLERRLRAALEPTKRSDPLLQALRARCLVCGQQGPRDLQARTRCSACQRPWIARAA